MANKAIDDFLTLLDGQTFGTLPLKKRSGSRGNLDKEPNGDLPVNCVFAVESDVAEPIVYGAPRTSMQYTVVTRMDDKDEARDTAYALYNYLNTRHFVLAAGNTYRIFDSPRFIGLDVDGGYVFEFLINFRGEK